MIQYLDFNGNHSLGNGFDKIFVDGEGSNLLLAIGCSWTRAWGSQESDLMFGDPKFQDDKDFMLNHSYVGKLATYLGADTIINMALPGSSIDLQIRFAVEFLQKNCNFFDKIFVIWGVTTYSRWELFSVKTQKPSMFQAGALNMPPGKEKEMNFFLQNHWDESYELERYSQKIVMFHSYLKLLNIHHLFFSTFESYNFTNMNLNNIDDCNFFMKNQNPNDMLSLWCADNHVGRQQKITSNPFSQTEINDLEELITLDYLSKKYAHPTSNAHQDIFLRLKNHIEQHPNIKY